MAQASCENSDPARRVNFRGGWPIFAPSAKVGLFPSGPTLSLLPSIPSEDILRATDLPFRRSPKLRKMSTEAGMGKSREFGQQTHKCEVLQVSDVEPLRHNRLA